MRVLVAALCAAAVLLGTLPARAEPVYFGAAARGPLPPPLVTAFRAAMERAMAKHGIKVLDASSVAVDSAKKDLVDAKAALAEATGAFTQGDWAGVLDADKRAQKLFEDGPAFSDDPQAWALFRDILSLRALTYLELHKKREADDALRALLVALPRYAPNREKAPAELIRHVDDIKDELRSLPPVSIEVTSRPAGARVLVDGRARGRSPLLVEELAPGVHYVALEAGGARYTERVYAGDDGARIDARLGSKKGAAAHDVVEALEKPTTAQVFVQSITEVDDDVLVGVLLPAGRKVEIIGARVVGGEVRLVCGIRTTTKENDREEAAYVLADALLTKKDDAWIETKGEDVADLRPKLFSSLGSTEVPAVDPDMPPPEIAPPVIALGVIGGVVVVAVAGTAVGALVVRELRKDQGFTFDVDTKGFAK